MSRTTSVSLPCDVRLHLYHYDSEVMVTFINSGYLMYRYRPEMVTLCINMDHMVIVVLVLKQREDEEIETQNTVPAKNEFKRWKSGNCKM